MKIPPYLEPVLKRPFMCVTAVAILRQPACWLLLLLLTIFSTPAHGQQQNVKFEHLNINDGLSQNHILCILQDSKGFMWFGTRDGLNKYDGYQFTVYKNDVKDKFSISNNFISGIVEGADGIIWIATRGGGLNRYDRNTNRFTHFLNDPANQNSISENLLDALTKDEKGNLWICTEETGVDCFEPAANRFTHYRQQANNAASLTDNAARSVLPDSKGDIWIGGRLGLNRLNKKTNVVTRYQHDENNKQSISENFIKTIFEDSRHRLWVGTDGGGLNLLDRSTGSFKNYTNDAAKSSSISADVVAAIGEDIDGNIWVGTENGGLNILDTVTGTFRLFKHDPIDNKSISQNSIYGIYRDNDGNMWVGTYAGGVNIFSKDANRFNHYYHTSASNSLSDNNVLCLSPAANGKIWIGTDGGGLNLFDPATKNFTHFFNDPKNKNSICGNYVLTACEDSKGNVWVGTWGNGITVFNPQKNTYRHFTDDSESNCGLKSNDFFIIMEDSEHNIWAGSYGDGLYLFDPATNKFINFPYYKTPLSKQVFSIAEDKIGNLWIGTDGGGVNILNKKTKTFTSLLHQDGVKSISDNRINYIYRDQHDNFWINTMSGLDYYDTKTKSFTSYTTENGLPNNVIFSIAEDAHSNLWLTTNRGLSMLNPVTKKFKNYSPADGLQSYEFKAHAVLKAATGALYFGGINGFNEFYPDRIKENDLDPLPVFTGFEIFNSKIAVAKDGSDPSPLKQDISVTKSITLSYNQTVFSFEFASLNYTGENKKQYSYMMEGFDKDWNYAGSKHIATYTNLDPATYVFKVRALNNKGEWSAKAAVIQLIITPPFWLTWWFRACMIAAFLLAVIAFIKLRTRSIRLQKIKLEEKVNEQTLQLIQSTKELEQKNKELEQFVYIASHDLQEPLRTTTSFIDLLRKQYKGSIDDRADKYLDFINESAGRMKTLIKDLLDYSRIGASKAFEAVDCNVTMQEVLIDLGTAIHESKAVITVMDLPVVKGYPTEIKQLFQNLLINAIKFRKKDVVPQITVSCKAKDDMFEFSVKDNGIGIAEEHREKIFNIFQRLHSKSAYEGSGIGLAHVKKIVTIHNGDIWVESTPGEGSAFNFTLPKY